MFTSFAGAGRPGRTRLPHPSRRLLTAGVTLAAALVVTPAAASAADVHVMTGGLDSDTCGPIAVPCGTIEGAHLNAADGDVIRVAAGTYTVDAGTDIDTAVQIIGAGKGQTIVRPSATWASDAIFSLSPPWSEDDSAPAPLSVEFAELTIEAPAVASGDETAGITLDAWDAAVNLTVRNAEFLGGGAPFTAVLSESNSGAITLDGTTLRGNGAQEFVGFGIQAFAQAGPITVQNSTFTLGGVPEGQFEGLPSAAVVSIFGAGALKVTGNTIVAPLGVLQSYTGPGEEEFRTVMAAEPAPISEVTGNRITASSQWAGLMIESVSWLTSQPGDVQAAEAPRAPVVIDGNVIDATAPVAGGETPSGVGGISVGGDGIDARVTRNSISGFGIGIAELYGEDSPHRIAASGNRIAGNEIGLYAPQFEDERPALQATNNWWGCNDGPGATGCDTIVTTEIDSETDRARSGRADATDGSVDATPHLVLGVTASPKAPAADGSAAVTASLATNSDGDKVDGVFSALAGNPAVSFTATKGTVDATAAVAAGLAKATFRSTAAEGRSVKGTLDNGSDTYTFSDPAKDPETEKNPQPAKPVPPVVDLNAPGLTDEQQRVLGYSTMLQCRKTPVIVFGVSLEKGRAVVTGVTDPKLAGRSVQLQFKPTGKKVVARAKIAVDGTYTVSTRAPKGALRDSDDARYRVRVPGSGSSPWLKLTRRLNVPTFKLSGRELTVKGKLAKPFARDQEVVISRRQACGPTKVLARLKANGQGRFGGTLTLGPNSTISTIRMTATVIGTETGADHRTYSLSQPVLVR